MYSDIRNAVTGSSNIAEKDAQMMAAKIAYFVHDLTDPAVHRRVQMLKAGGVAITPYRVPARPKGARHNPRHGGGRARQDD